MTSDLKQIINAKWTMTHIWAQVVKDVTIDQGNNTSCIDSQTFSCEIKFETDVELLVCCPSTSSS